MQFNLFSKLILVALLILKTKTNAQSQFTLPLSGNIGQQFILVNYVDWGAGSSIQDSHCDSKTYDGHQGTDFVIRDFKMMDAGVNVTAVKKGKVVFIQDGLFDREKTSVVSKQFGNYVAIAHSGSVQSYYAHLRKGSIVVAIGDSVVAGQKLGQVGSSGNSESPHLHFETWFDSTYYFDPFSGPCGNSGTYWLNEPAFDTSFGTWTSGMVNYICTLDTLKEGLPIIDTFDVNDVAITYWNLEYGLRMNDSLKIEWYDPNGILWFKYSYKVDRDWWYYYYSSYINVPLAGPKGNWSLKHYRNNSLVENRPFYFKKNTTTTITKTSSSFEKEKLVIRHFEDGILIDASQSVGIIRIYSLQGVLLGKLVYTGEPLSFSTKDIPCGICILEYEVDTGMIKREKILICH